MNLILFEPNEIDRPLSRDDPRAVHILSVLRRTAGDDFDAGLVNGRQGKGTLKNIGPTHVEIEFELLEDPPPLLPAGLLLGLPRPQTARKILLEIASLGVSEIHVVKTEKSEPSYAGSRLWTTPEWRRRLIAGAEQAFTTRLPDLARHESLETALDSIGDRTEVVALDNYEATSPLRAFHPARAPCILAVGAERGWGAAERDLFRQRNVPLLQLGRNVLRTETACLCGLTLLLANMELF